MDDDSDLFLNGREGSMLQGPCPCPSRTCPRALLGHFGWRKPRVEEHLDVSELSLRVFLGGKRRGSDAVVGGVGGAIA